MNPFLLNNLPTEEMRVGHAEPTSFTTHREECLDIAKKFVTRDRNLDYDEPENSFGRIAALWSVFLGIRIQPYHVAIMMGLVKIARLMTSPWKEDNWIDLAGYAACGYEIVELTKKNIQSETTEE